jgi:protein TonB
MPSGADLFRNGLDGVDQLLPEAVLAPGEVRRKYITANTEDWLYASYMNAWTRKVERVGNMNYPDRARREGLRGDLVLSVGIRADGSLESIEILRHSGFPVLDEAAIRIVELSAPFAELPAQITEDVDILYITRTWRFSPDSGSFN